MLQEKVKKNIATFNSSIYFFIFDKDKELVEEVDSLDDKLVNIVFYDNNPFETKLLLQKKSLHLPQLIYCQMDEPNTQEEFLSFPLLDLLVAGKVIRLDDTSDIIEDLNWRPQHKNLAEKYKYELKYKYVNEIVKTLDRDRLTEASIIRALFSAWLGATRLMREEWILGKLLIRPFTNPEDFNTFINKIHKYELQHNLKELIRNYFSREPEDFSTESISRLLDIMKYNCILMNTPEVSKHDPYQKIRITEFTRTEKLNNFREYLFNDADFRDEVPAIFLENSLKVKEEVIFREYGLKTSYYLKTPGLIWQILIELAKMWEKDPDKILKEIPELKKDIVAGSETDLASGHIYYASSVVAGIESVKNLVLDKPEEYLANYTGEWYKIDQDYRQAIRYFMKLNLEDVQKNLDFFTIHNRLNERYNQFLGQLNKEWLKCWSSKDFLLDNKKVQYQSEFFKREVEGRDVKVAVIISDGLRYEVGRELLNTLHKDSRNMAEMRWQFSSLPSVTSVGMANLLPAKERILDLENVLIDGENTKTTEQRRAILKKSVPEADAYLFKDVVNLTQKDGREIFSSPLVYIYHNRIDEQGDKSKTEQNTSEAVDKSVEELGKFIKKLHSSYFVNRVLITADHGFLYTYQLPPEKDLEQVKVENLVEKDSRFLLVSKGEQEPLGYKIPVEKVSPFTEKIDIIIPEGINRYRIQGAGKRYVHGGASLQEMVVPVIESIRKRRDITSKVNVIIPAKNMRIISNVLRLKLYQENPVSAREKDRTLKIGIYRNNELVSDEKEIILDSASENITERQHEIMLNLKPGLDSSGILTLKIFDAEDELNPLFESKVMNESSINPDF